MAPGTQAARTEQRRRAELGLTSPQDWTKAPSHRQEDACHRGKGEAQTSERNLLGEGRARKQSAEQRAGTGMGPELVRSPRAVGSQEGGSDRAKGSKALGLRAAGSQSMSHHPAGHRKPHPRDCHPFEIGWKKIQTERRQENCRLIALLRKAEKKIQLNSL